MKLETHPLSTFHDLEAYVSVENPEFALLLL